MTYEYAVGVIYTKGGRESAPTFLSLCDTLEEAQANAAQWNYDHEEWNRQELVLAGILPGAGRRYVVLFRQVPPWSVAQTDTFPNQRQSKEKSE